MPDNNTGLSEGLTDAERAYFSSGGTDTAALEKEYETSNSDQAPAPAAPAAAGGTGQPGAAAAAPGADDADDDGAIVIGADGKARDTLSGKYVPHHALHKERERRKATDAELMTVREKLARGEERLNVLLELVQGADAGAAKAVPGAAAPGAAKQAADADPFAEEPIDPEVDVFGALKQSQRQTAALLKRMQEGDQASKAKEASASVGNAYKSDAIAFARTQTDFGEAYNHLISSMHLELEAMGVTDEAARNRQIAEREKEFVAGILAAKGSPAAALYKVAKVRGYTPKAPGGQPAPGGAAPAPKPAADPAAVDPAAVAKLEAINKAKETVVSLGGSGGSAGGDTLTMEALANMSEAEFNATAKRIGKAGMARIMGG